MKAVEIRRHSLRTPPETHLSSQGVDLAVRVRAEVGKFDFVVSSPAVRAIETATALGFPPRRLDPLWEELGSRVSAELPWPTTFEDTRAAVGAGSSAAQRKSRELWDAVLVQLRAVSEGGRLLVITHGGFCELMVAGSSLPPVSGEVSGPIRCLEGVRFELSDESPSAFVLLRLPNDLTRI